MITFTCAGCGRSFTVPDEFAGRKARCKSCGAPVEVPVAAAAPAAPSAPTTAPKVPMRLRRLTADAEQMSAAFAGSDRIRVVSAAGSPPEVYQVEYHIKGLERPNKRKLEPVPRDRHLVEIQLTADYPRVSPACRMLTPVFHPNIDPAHVCVGDHWTAGERLVDLVIRIGEMLAYQAYNIKSPLDGEAAMWADLNAGQFPTDPRPLRPPGME